MAFPGQCLRWLAVIASVSLPAAALAQPVTVKDAWVRAPAPGQKVAAAYMELTSLGNTVLVGVASPAAATVEMHRTAVEAGVMKMRAVNRIQLPGGKAVTLAPGGLHLMLVDLRQPLKPGDRVPLTLTVQRADGNRSVFAVQAVVRQGTPEKTPPETHHHH